MPGCRMMIVLFMNSVDSDTLENPASARSESQRGSILQTFLTMAMFFVHGLSCSQLKDLTVSAFRGSFVSARLALLSVAIDARGNLRVSHITYPCDSFGNTSEA